MSWVCTNCSTSNEDSVTACTVCGMSRSTRTESSETEECKVFFSGFEAFKYSFKKMFSGSTEAKKEKKPKKKRESLPSSDDEARVEAPKVKKPRKPLFGSPFAEPWPEHKIKFDVHAIEGKGFVSSERESLNGVNGYKFYRADETTQFIRVEMALIQKMAHKI